MALTTIPSAARFASAPLLSAFTPTLNAACVAFTLAVDAAVDKTLRTDVDSELSALVFVPRVEVTVLTSAVLLLLFATDCADTTEENDALTELNVANC